VAQVVEREWRPTPELRSTALTRMLEAWMAWMHSLEPLAQGDLTYDLGLSRGRLDMTAHLAVRMEALQHLLLLERGSPERAGLLQTILSVPQQWQDHLRADQIAEAERHASNLRKLRRTVDAQRGNA
jgi:hypothetical protein